MDPTNQHIDPVSFDAIQPPRPPSPSDLEQAKKEEQALVDGRVGVQTELHAIAKRYLRYGAFLIAALVTVRFWHVAGPHTIFGWSTRWLTEAELQSMDKMLFSSAFGGLVLGYLKEIMQPSKK